jgi:hypothetical protein
MKKRLFSTVVLATVLGLSVLAAGQSYQLDIAMEGPWILFADTMVNPSASKMPVPVLVAVAPVGATKETAAHPKSHFHHWPQISSGNGFYLPPGGIFCLAFDNQCAPPAGTTFTKVTNDSNYPTENILALTGTAANKMWRSYGTNNVVVILPMPNLYHADGVWRMEFLSDHNSLDDVGVKDNGYPIGLILHYAKDPKRLQLYSCTSSPISVPKDCPKEAQDRKHHPIEVTNTGTVRLQMRAPDTTNICDRHVRFAFHQILNLLDPKQADTDYNNYRYIEPAIEMDAKDNGVFETSKGKHPCFDGDTSDQVAPLMGALHSSATTQETPATPAYPFTEALKAIHEQWKSSEPLLKILDKKPLFEAARADFDQAEELGGSLLISDVSRMGALLEQSAHEIRIGIAELHLESVRSESLNFNNEIDAVSKLEELIAAQTTAADDTKNGADCRAAQVLVQ